MSDTIGGFILGAVACLIGYHWLTAADRRHNQQAIGELTELLGTALDQRDQARTQRDKYRRLYAESVDREAVHLSRTGNVDQEWADWCARMDVERIWEAGDTDE